MRSGGFTLIEVLAVVALLGILAGATGWSLAEDMQRSSHAKVVGQIVHADHMARLAAQRLGQPCTLRFDLRRQRVWRVTGDEGDHRKTASALKLPAGYRIDRIMISGTSSSPGSAPTPHAGVIRDSGEADIAYSIGGRSAAYALRLVSRSEGEDAGSREVEGRRAEWLVFSGLTGQVTLDLDDNTVNNLFTSLAAGARPDAH